MDFSPWLWVIPAFIVIAAILWFVFWGNVAKRQLLESIPDLVEFEETRPEAYPTLDTRSLKSYTDGLKALGFAFALDYTYKVDLPVPKGFARLMIHPDRHCFAEINQIFAPGKKLSPMRCTFASVLEDDWELSTTDRKPELLNYIWRRPKAFWSSHPNLALEDLHQIHIENREKMKQRVGVAPLSNLTPEIYFTHEKRDTAEGKAVLESKNEWTILWEMRQFQGNPKYEWFGDDVARADIQGR